MKLFSVTIQMKAIKKCFPVVLFIMLYKLDLTFEYVVEILKCEQSNKRSPLSNILCERYFAVKFDSHFF